MYTLKYILLACVILGVDSLVIKSEKRFYNVSQASQIFEDFLRSFDKKYLTRLEHKRRFEIFIENLKEVNRRNKESDSVTFGVTKFSDMTAEEISKGYFGLGKIAASTGRCNCNNCNCTCTNNEEIKLKGKVPEQWDWRQHNIVTRVKDQGEVCGSCWAFAAVGAIESKHAKKHRKLIPLSEQQLLDCTSGDNSCDGGLPCEAIQKAAVMGGVMKESNYRYKAAKKNCKFDKKKVAVTVSGQIEHCVSGEDELKSLIYHKGPLVAGMQAGLGFSLYKSGIAVGEDLDCYGNEDLSHAVLIVGYGVGKEGQKYWIIKNSHGTDWGEEGYFKLERGKNVCKITDYIIEAIV